MALELKGAIVAIVTPFRDGAIDEEAFRKLIDFQIAGGISGIVPCGTTGESATMTHAEHQDLIRLTIDVVAGRVPVIAGTGSNATSEALMLTQSAKESGSDAALLIAPYYNKPTQEGIFQHFRTIAESVDLPLVLYNLPGRTGISINPDTVARLDELENVVAIKDATGSLDWTSEVCATCNLTVLSGDDSATLPQISVGAQGVISVLANIAPAATVKLVQKAVEGDHAGARAIHHKYFKLIKTLFIETNPIPIKAALEMMGMIGPEIRLPMTPLTDEHRAKLHAVMQTVGLL